MSVRSKILAIAIMAACVPFLGSNISFACTAGVDCSNATAGAARYDNTFSRDSLTPAAKAGYDRFQADNPSYPKDPSQMTDAQLKGIEADGKCGDNCLKKLSDYQSKTGTNGDSGGGPSLNTAGTIASPGFTFDPSLISPGRTYDGGSQKNIQGLLDRISGILIVAIGTLAALLIAVAGLRMALSGGNTEEASKGKTMLRFNLMAIAISLLSFALIKLVSWIISAT